MDTIKAMEVDRAMLGDDVQPMNDGERDITEMLDVDIEVDGLADENDEDDDEDFDLDDDDDEDDENEDEDEDDSDIPEDGLVL